MREVANREIARSAYPSGMTSAVDAVVHGSDADARCLVALHRNEPAAFVIYGHVAGSEGGGRIQLVMTDVRDRRSGLARLLIEAAVNDLREAGARFAAVEVPDDPALAAAVALLERCEFQVDARVRDFYRDGTDLTVFRRDIQQPG